MQLNDQQEEALAALLDFATNGVNARPFIFTGLAGTGKTTVVSRLILALEESGAYTTDRIAVVAYTGKAASVLNRKLVAAGTTVRAKTVHSLIYTMPYDAADTLHRKLDELEAAIGSTDDPARIIQLRDERHTIMNRLEMLSSKNSLRFERRDPEEVRSKVGIIIVDEASMIDPAIAADLAEIGVPTIYVGDSNQLPPVMKPFGVNLHKPDAKLTQIMRQQGDSGIIPYAHAILQNKTLPVGGNFDGVERSKSTNPLLFIGPDGKLPQYITAYNKTRHGINRTIRNHVMKVAGKEYLPLPGEFVMVDNNKPEKRLMKGDLLEVLSIEFEMDENFGTAQTTDTVSDKLKAYAAETSKYRAIARLRDQYGEESTEVLFLNDLMCSMSHPDALDPMADKRKFMNESREALAVMYPYAITAYKSQGSEWDSVVVINEKPKDIYLPFIYTAVTRARSKLAVVG